MAGTESQNVPNCADCMNMDHQQPVQAGHNARRQAQMDMEDMQDGGADESTEVY